MVFLRQKATFCRQGVVALVARSAACQLMACCVARVDVTVLSLTASTLTLTLIACDRFFGVVFALKAHLTERRPRVFLAIVWAAALLVSCPLLVYRRQMTRQWVDHLEIWSLFPYYCNRCKNYVMVTPLIIYVTAWHNGTRRTARAVTKATPQV